MNPGPVIYLPESTVGPQLKTTEIQDYNNYIKVKAPSQNVNIRETTKFNNSKKEEILLNSLRVSKEGVPKDTDQSMLGYADSYKAAQKRHFQ